jgi:hypothetical protein
VKRRPITEADRAAVRAAHADGTPLQVVACRLGRSDGVTYRLAKEMGLVFGKRPAPRTSQQKLVLLPTLRLSNQLREEIAAAHAERQFAPPFKPARI